jgi:hypothetical protein
MSVQQVDSDPLSHSRLWIQRLCDTLVPLSGSESKQLENEISAIVDEALNFDMLISKQAAELTWYAGRALNNPLRFDSHCMELDGGEMVAPNDAFVSLVLTPALIKQGRSTGEHFEEQHVLIKMIVSCQPMDTISTEQKSHAGSTFWSQGFGSAWLARP